MEKRIDSSLNTIDLDLAIFIMEEDDNYAVSDGRIVFIVEE